MMKLAGGTEAYTFEAASATHEGRVRKLNEDSIFTDDELGLWIVADGMGGHKHGEVASAMVTDRTPYINEGGSRLDLVTKLKNHLQNVNEALLKMSNGDAREIIGSTVVALVADMRGYTCIWAGDARCYLIRGGRIIQLSHDHTEVQELVDRGVINEDEAKVWPRRNVITRAVGADADLNLDIASGAIMPGDCFVLCSDGLTGHVEEKEILESVSWVTARDACQKLISLALERGGRDNVSVVVVNALGTADTTVVQRW